MKTLKSRFEENYMAVSVPANNKKGFKIEYIYYRPWHIWNIPEEELKAKKKSVLIAGIVGLLLFIATGAVNTPITQAAIVVIPAVLSLAAQVYELVGVFQFYFSPRQTTESNYMDVSTKLKIAPIVRAVLLGVTVLACCVNLIFQEHSALSVCVALSYLLQILLPLYIFKTYRTIPLKTEKNDNINKYSLDTDDEDDVVDTDDRSEKLLSSNLRK